MPCCHQVIQGCAAQQMLVLLKKKTVCKDSAGVAVGAYITASSCRGIGQATGSDCACVCCVNAESARLELCLATLIGT